MEEEEVLCRFGTPLEPLEEDEVPSKKPILIEDQIVTDENGRRRFHGAFTGGFSAGFWNTVGSLEGWTPKEFKSSRDEKFKIQQQKPTDFMDDEDFGEFGFAPQRVQTTADFTSKKDGNEENSKKRKHNKNNDGPIPGIPVLQQLLEPSKENVAIRLLKKMGWKEGQGIGARQTKSEKKLSTKHNLKEQYILKKYGCDMGPMSKADSVKSDSESDISDIDDITFAPDDFEPYVCAAKDNCFGLGYVGLSREPVLKQHINLFGPLEVLDNKKKKLSIRGKGFGVGALEEEDEDIYHHDDISNYDFSLGTPSNQKNKPKPKPQDFHIIDGFSERNETTIHTKKVFIVKIPPNYNPRNWLIRKSRFEPLDEKRAAIIKQQEEIKIKGLGRHDITLDERKEILEGTNQKSISSSVTDELPIDNNSATENEKGNKKKQTYLEKINKKYKIEDNKKDKVLSMLAAKSDNFVKSEIIKEDGTILKEESTNILSEEIQKENEKIINEAKKITKNMDTNSSGSFKPFLADSAKQERYEKYLSKKFSSDEEITIFLSLIQPSNMSEWERKMEKREFQQAEKIYKPLKGIMSDRFVTESAVTEEREIKKTDPNRKGKTIRTKIIWHPTSILCKRFNIAEPFVNLIKEENKTIQKPKLSVFDYLEASVNNKETFVTPIVIPHNEEIKISSPVNSQSENSKRLSAKEMFTNEVNANKNSKSLEKIPSIESKETEEVKNIPLLKEQKPGKIDRKIIAKEKPKTELELKIEELKNKHPSEKKDLYKTVFVSSSDSEDDEDKKNKVNSENSEKISKQINETEEITNNIKDLNVVFNKPASEVNILRNNSPPRGIFAAFFKDTETANKTQGFEIAQSDTKTESQNPLKDSVSETKIIFKSQNERNCKVSSLNNLSSSDIYGPMMPNSVNSSFRATTKLKNSNTEVESNIDSKIQNLLGKHKTKTKVVEEWVEVTSNSSSTKKNKKDKKKKKRKEKSKHKKRSSSTSSSSSSGSNSSSNINYSHRSKKKSKKSKKSKKHRK